MITSGVTSWYFDLGKCRDETPLAFTASLCMIQLLLMNNFWFQPRIFDSNHDVWDNYYLNQLKYQIRSRPKFSICIIRYHEFRDFCGCTSSYPRLFPHCTSNSTALCHHALQEVEADLRVCLHNSQPLRHCDLFWKTKWKLWVNRSNSLVRSGQVAWQSKRQPVHASAPSVTSKRCTSLETIQWDTGHQLRSIWRLRAVFG